MDPIIPLERLEKLEKDIVFIKDMLRFYIDDEFQRTKKFVRNGLTSQLGRKVDIEKIISEYYNIAALRARE